jgi:hypothetical protein
MTNASPNAPSSNGTGPQLQRYGRYILVDRLGSGGMAEVFRAVVVGPEAFQRAMVVKRILPHLTENQSFVNMFIDEATLCGRLSHPNIIQVHEFGKQEGTYFIAMEYVQGRNLAAILGRMAGRAENLPVNVAADMARQVCLGLAYAHALTAPTGEPLNIVHRDVTPANIMVSYAGQVKILDFGIARAANEARLSSTDAGQVKGKSSYLAPEQVRSGPIDGRADVFSLGIVLHEALTGRRLFKGANPLQTMKLIQEMPIVRPSKYNPAVPERLEEIVMKALHRKVESRYQSAGEMADDLESFLIEQRHSSQDVVRFMRGLFEAEMADDATLPQAAINAFVAAQQAEAEAAAAAAAESGGAWDTGRLPITTELSPAPSLTPPPRMGTPGVVSAVPGAIPTARITGSFDVSRLPSGAYPRVDTGSHHVFTPVPPPPPRTARNWLIGIALGATVLATGTTAIVTLRHPPSGGPVLGTQRSATGSGAAPERQAPAAAPAASRVVTISISSEPAEAEVLQWPEGKRLGKTPVSVELPRSSEAVDFRIVKEGYVPGVFKVVPDQNKPALVTLARAPSDGETGAAAEAAAKQQPPNQTGRPPRANRGKVRNAVPIDPFAK